MDFEDFMAIFTAAWVIGIPIVFGALIKLGPIALILAVFWPISGLAYLGHMVSPW